MVTIKLEIEVLTGAFCLVKDKEGYTKMVCPELCITEAWCLVFHKHPEEQSLKVFKLPQCLKAEIKGICS